jgi:hypothetical protein
VSEQEKVVGIKSYEGLSVFLELVASLDGLTSGLRPFILSWRYCTCFWLRLAGVGVKVFRGRGVCVLFF